MKRAARSFGVIVLPRTRRDGKQVFLVSGTINGRRIQIERVHRHEAEAEAATLNEQVAESGRARRPVLTSLNPEQLDDAEGARAILPVWATFRQAAEFFQQHFRPVVARGLQAAIDAYIEARRSQAKNSDVTLNVLTPVLGTIPRDTGAMSTADLTPETARRWIFAPGLEVRTQRDRFDHLNRFCRWLIGEHLLLHNPLANLNRPKWEPGPPTVLPVKSLAKLLRAAWEDPEGPQMVPFFAMGILSGVRPFELRRAEEDHWFLEARPALFEVHEAKGVWRTVELPENLRAILKECRRRQLTLAYWSKRKFDRVRRAAGVFDVWDNDILRHSSASYRYALDNNIRWLEANYGNSEKVLFAHYIRRNVRKTEARAFARLTLAFDRLAAPASRHPGSLMASSRCITPKA